MENSRLEDTWLSPGWYWSRFLHASPLPDLTFCTLPLGCWLQPFWPSFCFQSCSSFLMPQGLCTGQLLCLELFPSPHRAGSILKVLSPLQRGAFLIRPTSWPLGPLSSVGPPVLLCVSHSPSLSSAIGCVLLIYLSWPLCPSAWITVTKYHKLCSLSNYFYSCG
jgi:hypothetical protein